MVWHFSGPLEYHAYAFSHSFEYNIAWRFHEIQLRLMIIYIANERQTQKH